MNQYHQEDIAQIVRNAVERYKRFMKIEMFPKYVLELVPADNALNSANEKGFGRIAIASYDVRNDQHYLTITEGIDPLDYLLFHEFTHILDDEKFVANVEKSRQSITYVGMHGYEEYHASQIELMKLLGTSHVDDSISFSMSDKIYLFDGDKTVEQYLMNKYNLASDLFSRPDFPADEDTLSASLGVLYNYWGLRSICEMYAREYKENVDNYAFLNQIGSLHFAAANNEMHGWFDTHKAIESSKSYAYLLFPLKKQMENSRMKWRTL